MANNPPTNDELLVRAVIAIERIADKIEGTVNVRDIDRAKVYSEHLGKKLEQ
jgi:hypothetical protein